MILEKTKFKMFTVISFSHIDKNYSKYYNCICDCGNQRKLSTSSLKAKYPISCGCYKRGKTKEIHTTHGKYKTKEYNSWAGAKSRCYNKNNPKYYLYGARGIKMCGEWRNNFETFLNDMGKCPQGYSIDRIDSNKDYCKENCRWASPKEQSSHISSNKFIEYQNMQKHLSEWARYFNIPLSTIRTRLRKNKPLSEVFCVKIK